MQALTIEQPVSSRLAGEHTAWTSIILHLLPGLLTGAVYYLLAEPVARLGLPSIVTLMAAGMLVILPFEMGVIAYAAKSHPQPRPFWTMIGYRERIPFWHFLILVPTLLGAAGLVISLMAPITNAAQGLFGWLPESMQLNLGAQGGYAKNVLLWVTVFNGLLIGILLPVVEEIYFRGFLLPRMPRSLKGWAPLANSFLFAVYHTWSPWLIPARTIGLLPLFYAVRKERSILLGIIVHCLANLIDVAAMIGFVAAMN